MPAGKRATPEYAGKKAKGTSPYANRKHADTREAKLKWSQVPAQALLECIDSVHAAGHAISFARSRNGSSLSFVILAGDDRPRWVAYDLDEAVENLLEASELAASATPED